MHSLFQPSFVLPVLAAWSGQIVILAGVGAFACLAIANPKARLLLWQALLIAMFLLPAVEPWKHPVIHVTSNASGRVIFTGVAAPPKFHWQSEDWLALIGIGIVLRLAWVAIGFWRLRRYRRLATPLPEAPLRFASSVASWYTSDSVPGPVTYGWRRPVILLPSRVMELPDELREAVQCHELIHVLRRDWLFVLAEALLRSLLWFHPAIWFVLARIQLTREQVVDREAVKLLRSRETYLDALVAVASQQLQPEVSSALLFLRKRQLLARVEGVVKEIKMSRSRIIAATAAVCSALPLAVWAGMSMFPLVGSAQIVVDDPGIAVSPGGPILHREPVHAPAGFTTGGTVVIDATVDEQGSVADASVVSGPESLRKSALTSVLQWKYQPGRAHVRVQVQFQGGSPTMAVIPLPVLPPLKAPLSPEPQPAPQPLPSSALAAGARPGGDVSAPIPVYRAEPQYSPEALKAQLQGSVTLSLVVDENGKTQNIHVIRPLGLGLDEQAIEAVSKWTFKPGLKNGVAVPVQAQIEVTFRLPEGANGVQVNDAKPLIDYWQNLLDQLRQTYTDRHPLVVEAQRQLDAAQAPQ